MNSTIKKKNRNTYSLLFWSSVWLFYVLFFSYNSNNINYILTFSTILILITAITTYVMVYLLIPKYLSVKKYTRFGIYTFFTLLFTTFCIVLFLIISIAYFTEFTMEDLPLMVSNYIFIVVLVYLVVAIASYTSLWRKNLEITIVNKELQKQYLSANVKEKEQELVNEANIKNTTDKEFLVIRSDRKMIKVNLADIVFIESFSDYLKLHTLSKIFITRETISNFESKLPSKSFIRVHRSFIVSIQFISSYASEYVEVQGKAITISRSYRNSFLKKMESE